MQSSMITTKFYHILKTGSVKYTQQDLHLQEFAL